MFGLIRNELLLVGLIIAIAPAKPERAPVEAAPSALRVTSNSSDSQPRERLGAPQERAPRFIGEGRRITVPPTSPLRSELVIATVAAKETQRMLELPGVVEADPARTVKVLPPVAGRVVDLKVQLGDRVAQQQELALVYVGDLTRTRFDTREGRPMMAIADRRIGSEQPRSSERSTRRWTGQDFSP
jgi:multidrug efflux pump subunit AcrA (membrane-fusion protein)